MRDALLLHHSVMGSTPNLNFAALINLADHLAGAVGFPYDRLAPLEPINPRALQLLSVSPQELEELHPKVVQVFLRERTPFNERR